MINPSVQEISIHLPSQKINLSATLTLPENATKIIVFAHGSGSGRLSPRNQAVAKSLVDHSMATLLLDLLTEEEESIDQHTGEFRFNIPLLANRLIEISHWLKNSLHTKSLKIGYFGASTGAAAALIAAAAQGPKVFAVVSRGGRPDLADKSLSKVQSPTLLIVGGNDFEVIELNKSAFDIIPCEKKLTIVPGATHLFAEPGTLEQVSKLAVSWFTNH